MRVGCRFRPEVRGFRDGVKCSLEAIATVCASIALPSAAVVDECHTVLMNARRANRVTLSGDLTGEYVVVEQRDDGSVVVKPDTSMAAIRRRLGVTSATLEEFVAEYGPIQPPDGEG
jgi:hypothetical protein